MARRISRLIFLLAGLVIAIGMFIEIDFQEALSGYWLADSFERLRWVAL